jgi:hypothetical protein
MSGLLQPLPPLSCTPQEAALPCSQLHIVSVKHTQVTASQTYAACQ